MTILHLYIATTDSKAFDSYSQQIYVKTFHVETIDRCLLSVQDLVGVSEKHLGALYWLC
jgi:hypothetical protein